MWPTDSTLWPLVPFLVVRFLRRRCYHKSPLISRIFATLFTVSTSRNENDTALLGSSQTSDRRLFTYHHEDAKHSRLPRRFATSDLALKTTACPQRLFHPSGPSMITMRHYALMLKRRFPVWIPHVDHTLYHVHLFGDLTRFAAPTGRYSGIARQPIVVLASYTRH